MLLQLIEGNFQIDRFRIAQHMQIILFEIDDLVPVRVKNVGVADIPFVGDHPVEGLGA